MDTLVGIVVHRLELKLAYSKTASCLLVDLLNWYWTMAKFYTLNNLRCSINLKPWPTKNQSYIWGHVAQGLVFGANGSRFLDSNHFICSTFIVKNGKSFRFSIFNLVKRKLKRPLSPGLWWRFHALLQRQSDKRGEIVSLVLSASDYRAI